MSNEIIHRPEPGEYPPYAEAYVSLVKGENILNILEQQRREMMLLLSSKDEKDGEIRYAPGKWTARQVLGHINDAERIFAYRALRISRGDATPLAGFEENDYVREGPFEHCTLADVIEDFIAVRRSSISLFRNLDGAAWTRQGTANNHPTTVRALAYLVAGHELHHRRILEQKYFAV